MKYVIRRALVGVVSIPLIAGAYVFLYLLLLLAGAEPNLNVEGAFDNGILIGITTAIFFTFATQFSRLLDRITSV
jgi:hypothetical protein